MAINVDATLADFRAFVGIPRTFDDKNWRTRLTALVMVNAANPANLRQSAAYNVDATSVKNWLTCDCAACGRALITAATVQIDHMYYKHDEKESGEYLNRQIVQGRVDVNNFQLLCAECNGLKSDKWMGNPAGFREYVQRLLALR